LGCGYSPTFSVLDLDSILDGIPDRADLQDVDLFLCGFAQIGILLGHVKKITIIDEPDQPWKGAFLCKSKYGLSGVNEVLGPR
jgi:hypothetical protein